MGDQIGKEEGEREEDRRGRGRGRDDGLRTKTTTETGTGATRVSLDVEYAFTNPIYEAMSLAAAPKAADAMIGAFQRRVHEVLGAKR